MIKWSVLRTSDWSVVIEFQSQLAEHGTNYDRFCPINKQAEHRERQPDRVFIN